MIFRRIVTAILSLALLANPALATDRKPIVLGTSGQQQQIQSADTLSTPALKVTGISGSTQCVQASTAGLLSGTGTACGSGGGSGALTLIQKITADGTTGVYTFSSIPGSYTDLELRISGRSSYSGGAAASVNITVNGLTTAIYDQQRSLAINASPSSDQTLGGAQWSGIIELGGTTITDSHDVYGGSLVIQNYASTTFYKLMWAHTRYPDSTTTHDGYVITATGQVRTASAITSVTCTMGGSANFVSGSVIALYGVS